MSYGRGKWTANEGDGDAGSSSPVTRRNASRGERAYRAVRREEHGEAGGDGARRGKLRDAALYQERRGLITGPRSTPPA